MRLYAAISHHGFGHLAQTAPVLNVLADLAPGMELIVRSALPEAVIARRVRVPFRHLDTATDCNFVMRDALHIDLPASEAAYRAFHADWPRRVGLEAEALAALDVDLVYSNVGYLPLAAAQAAGIPCVALCSLNWADIFAHYLGHRPGAGAMLDVMRAAYAGADRFLRPEPSMAMNDLVNTLAIPPIAQPGRARHDELRASLGLAPGSRLVLVGLGGIPHRLPVEAWPVTSGVAWLVPDEWRVARTDVIGFAATGMAYADLLASADALVTKPGYGSFVEAVRAGVPVLHLPRPDWPETPCLVDWLHASGRAREIDASRLAKGDLRDDLEALWAMPVPAPIQADGAEVAAVALQRLAARLV